jgi:transposase-like protein
VTIGARRDEAFREGDGARYGTTTEESAELKRLRRENAELGRANAILKTVSDFFAVELDRPTQ